MAYPTGCFSYFLIVLVAAAAILPLAVHGNYESDALYALKQSLSDPNGVLASWDSSLVDACTWFHITCDQNNHVIRLDLGMSNLAGHLVPDLGKLDHLQYLELFKNNIEGTIPAELGNMKNLISLDLYNNKLSGSIPPSLGNLKSLVFLRLNNNQLTGRVPKEITDIPTLKVVDFSNNNLCGPIRSFQHVSWESFENNPRMVDGGMMELDSNCN
ncbi:hypothetical protein SAY86_019215 [Trapa natans]|uniref:Leucine-rich repeat-containing N-terminal plant-type domain-containing protein n=1 Tax=Trapa natans TaxID=22666 RepID=A0AAN7QZK4_TRANT|nr:hypothetical protein SAY86_019215 [Trapa natans]